MKVLIIRFSSIGDIVLTTPVVRCVKQQIQDVEVHYLTKSSYQIILQNNPYIDKVWTIKNTIDEIVEELKKERFDFIIDLHHNLRTASLKTKLRVPSKAFPKINFQKWLLVNFKKPISYQGHVVDRYFETVQSLNVVNDQKSCDFFIPEEDQIDLRINGVEPKNYLAVAVGAKFETKQLPIEKTIEVLKKVSVPIVLLGDRSDEEKANEITKEIPCIDLTGKINLNASAWMVKNAKILLTNDTGLMHIGSAFDTYIVSVWGNTVPAFGMYPYRPNNKDSYTIHEVLGLNCRPCSKIGFHKCPKGHFNCMMLQDTDKIAEAIRLFVEK